MRICAQKYGLNDSNLGDLCKHLTNYAINKDDEAFLQPLAASGDDGANKRLVTELMRDLRAEGGDTDRLWEVGLHGGAANQGLRGVWVGSAANQ